MNDLVSSRNMWHGVGLGIIVYYLAQQAVEEEHARLIGALAMVVGAILSAARGLRNGSANAVQQRKQVPGQDD